MVPMIDVQLLNDALLAIGLAAGLAIALCLAIVTSAAVWRWHERKAGVRQIEQHLAAATAEHSPTAAS